MVKDVVLNRRNPDTYKSPAAHKVAEIRTGLRNAHHRLGIGLKIVLHAHVRRVFFSDAKYPLIGKNIPSILSAVESNALSVLLSPQIYRLIADGNRYYNANAIVAVTFVSFNVPADRRSTMVGSAKPIPPRITRSGALGLSIQARPLSEAPSKVFYANRLLPILRHCRAFRTDQKDLVFRK